MVEEALDTEVEPLLVARAQDEQVSSSPVLGLRRQRRGRLLDHEVGVHSAEAEGTDAGPAGQRLPVDGSSG